MTNSKDNVIVSSAALAKAIGQTDLSGCAATVIGYGTMGQHFVSALKALGVGRIRVCSRSSGPLAELDGVEGVTALSGGYTNLTGTVASGELAIVATPTADLVDAVKHLAACGFRKILIEKPVSFFAEPINQLAQELDEKSIDGVCAYNRVAYPSLIEARARVEHEGGITSCTYDFTELVSRIGPGKFSAEELARWGIANSLHVMSMAHSLIGPAESWQSYKKGAIAWHPAGSVFVGSGMSESHIPFSFHADWGSTGRWSVEVHTGLRSYRFCPLEKLFCRAEALGDWNEIPVTAFAPEIKEGIAEQVAAMLSPEIRQMIPLVSISQAAGLTRFGEELFVYSAEQTHINVH